MAGEELAGERKWDPRSQQGRLFRGLQAIGVGCGGGTEVGLGKGEQLSF